MRGVATAVLERPLWFWSLALVVLAAGLGLRDPWPPDEPRFVLVARDMLLSGEWLFPRVAGDVYADKPPLFMWAVAAAMAVTGSLRVGFLLPSLLAALGVLWLVRDLATRLHGPRAGALAGLALLLTLQFTSSAKLAQIDMLLTLWTTLGLYGISRHLMLGPDWRAWTLAWAAMGLGIITKAVGFLPLAMLLFLPLASRRDRSLVAPDLDPRWWLGPLALVLATLVWLLPMWAATGAGGAELAGYREEILFRQTFGRYTGAWHHQEPWYYLLLQAPLLWLPLTLVLPWALRGWREAWRAGDGRWLLLVGYVLTVLVFFSLSTGKRGVYLLPALPALVVALAPTLERLAARRLPARAMVVTASLLVVSWVAAVPWSMQRYDAQRSGAALMAAVEAELRPGETLGLIGFREQSVLQAQRVLVHFGFRRTDYGQETLQAAAWTMASPSHHLLLHGDYLPYCWGEAAAEPLVHAHRRDWYLVDGSQVDARCRRRIERGEVDPWEDLRRYELSARDDAG